MKVLTILLALTTTPALAQSARTDIVYLTYCPTDVGDCIKQPDTDVVLPE
jgi:hypothetical protein